MPSLFSASARAMKFSLRGPEPQSRGRSTGRLTLTTSRVSDPEDVEEVSPGPVGTTLPLSFKMPERTPPPVPPTTPFSSAELPGIETMGAIAERAASAGAFQDFQTSPTLEKSPPGWQSMWEQHDLPDELLITQLTTPQQIRNIVTESFSHLKAIRASEFESIDPPEQRSELEGHSSSFVPGQGHAPYLRAPIEVPEHRSGSINSNRSASSNDGTVNTSLSSSSRHSVESLTTAGSDVDLLPMEPDQNVQGQKPNLNLLSPLSRFDLGKDYQRRARKHGIMKVFRGKEDSFRSPKQDSLKRKPPPPPPLRECASCFDDIPFSTGVGLTCQHSYCPKCFAHLVTTAMQHENFWPPKCCLQEIPEKTLEAELSALQLANFRLKAKEYATPAGERWYCAKPECGKWFNKRNTRPQDAAVVCSHCNFRMCLFCRAASHLAGERCAQDRGLEATLAAAELEGWRQCYNCHTMVELQSGCRHITCKCRAEFCYTCGAIWRTCRCTEDDQTRRRDQLAARRAVAQQEEAEMQAAIEAVAQAGRQEREAAEAEEARIREAAERDEQERVEREEARLAEEMRQFEEMEAARLEKITSYLEELRIALADLHQVQERAIRKRQTQQRTNIQQRLESVVSAEGELEEELGQYTLSSEETWRSTGQKHAVQTIETAKRHRVAQDQYFLLVDDSLDDQAIGAITLAHRLDELSQEQEAERVALRGMQDHERTKLMVRLKTAHEAGSRKRREALLLEKQDATQAVGLLERSVFSDGKWLERLREERAGMVEEEERRLVASGAEVPEMGMVLGVGEVAPGVVAQPYRVRRAGDREARQRKGRRERAPVMIEWVVAV